MAGITPTQERSVDPFASYNSNVVNRLTNMVTRGYRGLPTVYDLQVTQKSSTRIWITGGWCFKDDVMIEVTDSTTEMQVLGSLEAESNYAHSFDYMSAEAGSYYVVLYYNYEKSRPAPVAKFQLISENHVDTQYSSAGDYVLLKVLTVSAGGAITAVSDVDPSRTYNKREYLPTIIGAVPSEPTFDTDADTGRIIFDIATDTMKYGAAADWKVVGTGTTNKVTKTITAPGDWVLSGSLYYNNVDTTSLALSERSATVSCLNVSTNDHMVPWRIQFSSTVNCRLWMPVNTVSIFVTVIA